MFVEKNHIEGEDYLQIFDKNKKLIDSYLYKEVDAYGTYTKNGDGDFVLIKNCFVVYKDQGDEIRPVTTYGRSVYDINNNLLLECNDVSWTLHSNAVKGGVLKPAFIPIIDHGGNH